MQGSAEDPCWLHTHAQWRQCVLVPLHRAEQPVAGIEVCRSAFRVELIFREQSRPKEPLPGEAVARLCFILEQAYFQLTSFLGASYIVGFHVNLSQISIS